MIVLTTDAATSTNNLNDGALKRCWNIRQLPIVIAKPWATSVLDRRNTPFVNTVQESAASRYDFVDEGGVSFRNVMLADQQIAQSSCSHNLNSYHEGGDHKRMLTVPAQHALELLA